MPERSKTKLAIYVTYLNEALIYGEINTKARISAFLA